MLVFNWNYSETQSSNEQPENRLNQYGPWATCSCVGQQSNGRAAIPHCLVAKWVTGSEKILSKYNHSFGERILRYDVINELENHFTQARSSLMERSLKQRDKLTSLLFKLLSILSLLISPPKRSVTSVLASIFNLELQTLSRFKTEKNVLFKSKHVKVSF